MEVNESRQNESVDLMRDHHFTKHTHCKRLPMYLLKEV